MSQRFSLGHLSAEHQRQAKEQLGAPTPEVLADVERRASKYHNTPVEIDGKRFDSKLEARYYQMLKARWQAGEVAWFIRQVPFELPGKIVYRADFLVVLIVPPEKIAESVEIVDCKGVLTDVSRIKIRQVEELYGIKVRLWPERKS